MSTTPTKSQVTVAAPAASSWNPNPSGSAYMLLDVWGRKLWAVSDFISSAPSTSFGTFADVPGPRDDDPVNYPYVSVPDVLRFRLAIHDHADVAPFLRDVRVVVDHLLTNLTQLTGTEELDWTTDAVRYAKELEYVCAFPRGVGDFRPAVFANQRELVRDKVQLVTAADVFTQAPDLVDPRWATMTDRELNGAARTVWHTWRRHIPGSHIDDVVVGIRSWLWKYRQDHAGPGLTIEDVNTWFTSDDPAAQTIANLADILLHADTSDAGLTGIAKAVTSDAAEHGIALVGVEQYLTGRRHQLRKQVRARLAAARAEFTAVEDAYNSARTRRNALLAQIIAWNLPTDTDASLARDSGMSHTGVSKIRDRIAGPGDDTAESQP